jgi:GTP pyrophosphokinase
LTTVVERDFLQLKEKAQQYLPPEKIAIIEKAYAFSAEAHKGQVRKSGEPFLEHPLQTALILAELQLDTTSLAAALLHDITEDCGIPIVDIEARFGPEVSKLVDGVTKLGKLTWQALGVSTGEIQAENLRKMLVAMAEDLRVVFIKLADRLHNMRTLDALAPDKQRIIAQETLDIYSPLAHRLGIWELKWQLEDLAFHCLEPDKYRWIAEMVATKRVQRERFITHVIGTLKAEFEKDGLRADISGRPKHIYSIHQKMERYAALGKRFDDIHDLLALRVLVATVPDCYHAVGIVHNIWHPLPDEFNDYIANPKPNGYQSIHTTVMCLGTTPLEVQIRTRDMHYVAEYGVAAHWRYKQGQAGDIKFEERVGWLRQLIEWHRELSGAEEFLESVKTDIFIDQVFVFTPKGEIKDLPKGSTPLDFAYRIHSEFGHRCIGAKVNGKLVSLEYALKNGDVVQIMTTKAAKGPSRDWLSPHLGYIKTSQAKERIRQWFKRQERTENIERGRQMLDKELKQMGIEIDRDELAKMFSYPNTDDFLAAIGYGGVSTTQVTGKLAARQEPPKLPVGAAPQKVAPTSGVYVLGMSDLVTHIAGCCHPLPGEKIIGYITRGRGVTIHRQDCYNVLHEDEKDRLIPVQWGKAEALYPAHIQVEAWDRVGLMRDITTVVAEENVNIDSVNLESHGNHTVSTSLVVETAGLAQLSRLLKRIEAIRGVTAVTRMGDGASLKSEGKTLSSDGNKRGSKK